MRRLKELLEKKQRAAREATLEGETPRANPECLTLFHGAKTAAQLRALERNRSAIEQVFSRKGFFIGRVLDYSNSLRISLEIGDSERLPSPETLRDEPEFPRSVA